MLRPGFNVKYLKYPLAFQCKEGSKILNNKTTASSLAAQLWPSLAARAEPGPRQDENVEQLQAGAETCRPGGEWEAEEEIREDREDSSPHCERSHQKQKSDQVTPPSRGFDISSQVDLSYISRLKQDLVERARNSRPASGQDLKVETLYVDSTRNVGVALGRY